LPLDHVHDPAERMEHYIDPQLQAELRREMGRGTVTLLFGSKELRLNNAVALKEYLASRR